MKQALSTLKDEEEAILEIKSQLFRGDGKQIIFLFVSSLYDLFKIEAYINEYFDDNVIACTTSGELSFKGGYTDHSIAGFSLSKEKFNIKSFVIENPKQFDVSKTKAMQDFVLHNQSLNSKLNCFGLLLIDGLSITEESIAGILAGSLPSVPFVGWSSGDDLKFKNSQIFVNGSFKSGRAVFSIVFTRHIFKIFKTQHFIPDESKKFVITKADPEKRIVYEINGYPAAEEYAKMVKVNSTHLEPMTFSKYPVMLKIGGEYFVRSIQKVNSDQSLTFFCAIDEGLVLTVARGVDIIENLQAELKKLSMEFKPEMTLVSECVLRKLELIENNLTSKSSQIMRQYRVIGFHTFGEQINGLHVNQTITGIMIGKENE